MLDDLLTQDDWEGEQPSDRRGFLRKAVGGAIGLALGIHAACSEKSASPRLPSVPKPAPKPRKVVEQAPVDRDNLPPAPQCDPEKLSDRIRSVKERILPKGKFFDVSYLWHRSIDAVRDYMHEVANALGPDVSRDLHVVQHRNRDLFGLVYSNPSHTDRKSRAVVAERHKRTLSRVGLDGAAVFDKANYSDLYNVTYGAGPNLDALKKTFGIVYHVLGEGVGKDLYIEQSRKGRFVLVYKRRGEKTQTAFAARRHACILESHGIDASIRREWNDHLLYGESSYLNDTEMQKHWERSLRRAAARRAAAGKGHEEPEEPAPEKAGDSELTSQIRSLLKNLRSKNTLNKVIGLGADELTAWSVLDLETGEKLASYNEERPMQTGSMFKTFVVAAYLHEVGAGNLRPDSREGMHLTRIIQDSSNVSTNYLMKLMGGPAGVQKILKENYGDIFMQTDIRGYLPLDWKERLSGIKSGSGIVPKGDSWYSNKASARDYSRFLHALWHRKIPGAEKLLALMALPNMDRIYHGANHVPHGTGVFNKTGTTARMCGDMGILYAQGRDGNRYAYTLVGIVEKKAPAENYGLWKADRCNIIREVSNIVYDEMKKRHDLR